jgi:hypothetical protein
MKIFVYENNIPNYLYSEKFSFIAANIEQANTMAKQLMTKHNQIHDDNYMLSFDKEVKEFEIKPGYIPMNDIQIKNSKPVYKEVLERPW